MLEVYATCPYCLNDKLSSVDRVIECYCDKEVTYKIINYGTKPIDKGLFKKEYKWKRYKFWCHKCGMQWVSPEFPIIENDIKLNNAIFRSWKNSRIDAEVQTLLLGVIDNDKDKRN